MSATTGYLQLGTGISGTTVVTPPSGTNYYGQPIAFSAIPGGIQISSQNCVFGPVSGSWGTLTSFGVTDASGNAVVAPGTLQQPFTPVNGQLVVVPPGNISLVIGSQFAAGPGAFVSRNASGPTATGSVGVVSEYYTQVVGSGAYNVLSLQNMSQSDTVSLRVGDGTQPASGAVPTAVLGPFGTWPPGNSTFVPNGPVWAISRTDNGTTVAFMTG